MVLQFSKQQARPKGNNHNTNNTNNNNNNNNAQAKWMILALIVIITIASLMTSTSWTQQFLQAYKGDSGSGQSTSIQKSSEQQIVSLKSPQIFYSTKNASSSSSQNGHSTSTSTSSNASSPTIASNATTSNKVIPSPKPVTLQARQNPSSPSKPINPQLRQPPPRRPGIISRTRGTGPLYERGPWDGSPVIIEKYKLMFFTVPKTGTTVFKQLLRRMMGIKDWYVQQDPWIPHAPGRNGLKYLYDYSAEQGNEFLTSPDWTRAIFVRDPKQRVLSAYMDKALGGNGWYVRAHCCGISAQSPYGNSKTNQKCQPLAPFSKNITKEVFPFETFVKKFMSVCNDPHWRPQAKRMPDDAWKHINFVGYFSDLKGGSRKLLDRLGDDVWEKFGAHDWPGVVGGGAMFETNTMTHKTSSADYIDKVFTQELDELVYKFYREDYEHSVMNFTKPPNVTLSMRIL